ncbi:MAG: MarR family transcriptional regulator [Deltaproteobacteria bacterium]|nr:MarR family transcriptional regulator [Deltaproteobacteria bacterium]
MIYGLAMSKDTSPQIIEQLRRIARKKSELEKEPHEYGTGILMQHAEMYMVEVLGQNEGLSVTRIAAIMQITKGAVSQTLKKLEAKGLVQKYADPANASRTLLYLSADGKRVLKAHQKWHRKVDGGFSEYLDGLEGNEVLVIRDFLNRYEFFLDNRNS